MLRQLFSSRIPVFTTATVFAFFSLPCPAQEAAPPDYRFQFEVLAENLPQPMTMQEAPDGRIFFIEIAGKVKVFDPTSKLTSEIGALTVTNAQENGLLGMALGPDFANNQWIYFLHSPPDYDGQYISRFTLKDGK
ncbi:MAG: PQQ-dependent sugar dehydrogenase, partial [Verrucomicrobiales bacterium]